MESREAGHHMGDVCADNWWGGGEVACHPLIEGTWEEEFGFSIPVGHPCRGNLQAIGHTSL